MRDRKITAFSLKFMYLPLGGGGGIQSGSSYGTF